MTILYGNALNEALVEGGFIQFKFAFLGAGYDGDILGGLFLGRVSSIGGVELIALGFGGGR